MPYTKEERAAYNKIYRERRRDDPVFKANRSAQQQRRIARLKESPDPLYDEARRVVKNANQVELRKQYTEDPIYRAKVAAQAKTSYHNNRNIILTRAKVRNAHKRKERQANNILNKAIREGIIVRQPCWVCGDPKTSGHHPDYDQPLGVTWLCHRHHMQLHREFEREG